MNIIVSKDIVKLNENHSENHYGEYNVNECVFEFDEYFDSVPIKKAIFTSQSNNKSFEIDIINNKCTVPHEVLTKVYDTVILGVYGYDVNEETLLVRYSPEPTTFVVHEGSYKEGAEQPEIITPTQYDMYSKALQEGLAEVDKRLDDVEKQGDYASEQGDYAKEQGDYAKSEGDNAKSVAEETEKKAQEGAFDGKSLEFVWEGTKLGVRLEGQEEYHFVDLQGKQGEIGATGEPFKIKKTYASVSEMNADFRNMEFGDYVMIASSVEVEDNAKLYTRGESAWIFISDFSGAMGIRGETGLTPNIKIGEVKTLEAGSQAKVTRSGSNEEPVLNFEIPKGDKGDNYVLTEEDKVEIGKKVNTEYEERIEQNEKYISELEATIDILTNTDTKKGELVHITDALPLATFENKVDGNVKQETTKGNQLLDFSIQSSEARTTFTFENDILTIKADGASGYQTYYKTITNLIKNNPGKSISFNFEKFEFATNHGSSFVQINVYYNDGTAVGYNVLLSNVLSKNKYNIPSYTSNIREAQFSIYANAETAIANTITVTKPMLTFDENAPYEPFTNGASPNPEYPQEIEVIEGDLSFKVNGKNLGCTYNHLGIWEMAEGVMSSLGESDKYLGAYCKVKEGSTYSVSRQIISNRFGVGVCKEIPNANSTILVLKVNNSADKFENITIPKGYSYLVFYLSKDETYTDVGLQIEKNPIPTDYEPYKEQIIPLDLKGNFVGAINENIKDYLVTDKKKYWLVKNVGKVVFNGSESWMLNGGTTDYGQYMNTSSTPDKAYGKINIISDKFISKYSNDSNSIAGRDVSNYIFLTIAKSIVSFDLNVFKTWLSNNNVTVYYQLAEPQIIELGELPEPIKTFEGINNIQLLANLDTEIEVVYALDVKKYFENKLASIQEQIL